MKKYQAILQYKENRDTNLHKVEFQSAFRKDSPLFMTDLRTRLIRLELDPEQWVLVDLVECEEQN